MLKLTARGLVLDQAALVKLYDNEDHGHLTSLLTLEQKLVLKGLGKKGIGEPEP